MSAAGLLDRLDGVKSRGAGRWVARCPAHSDRRPSLAIRETDEGVVLLKCWSGCGAAEILAAVGMDFAALFPSTESGAAHPIRRPWTLGQALEVLSFEALLVAVAACDIGAGKPLSGRDRARVLLAHDRVQHIIDTLRGDEHRRSH